MGKRALLDLQFPLGGLDRRLAYRRQPPYTTPDVLNVRPVDVSEKRARGGSRPGLVKAYHEQLPIVSPGSPVRMLAGVTCIKSDGLKSILDEFDGDDFGDSWTPGWSGSLPLLLSGGGAIAYQDEGSAYYSAITGLDTAQDYQVELFIAPYGGKHWGTYIICLRMNNSTPSVVQDGMILRFTITGDGAWSWTVSEYVSGIESAQQADSGGDGVAQAGVLKFAYDQSAGKVYAYWNGVLLNTGGFTCVGSAGSRVGFGIGTTTAGGVCLVDSFRVVYRHLTPGPDRRDLVVATAGGYTYKADVDGEMKVISGTPPLLASDREMQAVDRFQKLYIADNSDPVLTSATGAISSTDRLDCAEIGVAPQPLWTELGLSFDASGRFVVVITSPASVAGTYQIYRVEPTYIRLYAPVPPTTASGVVFRIEAAPKVYDPETDTMAIWKAATGKGQVPSGCPLLAMSGARIYMGGAPIAAHAWYSPRTTDPLDFDYSQQDAEAAVAGTSGGAGKVGSPLTAIISHGDDYTVFACRDSLMLMRGDPAAGGTMDTLSNVIGVVGKSAWCHTPAGELVFLSRNGLYVLSPGGGGGLQALSVGHLPNELLDIDAVRFAVAMVFDVLENGIYLTITSQVTTEGAPTFRHYWVEWATKSIWPLSLTSAHCPFTLMWRASEQPGSAAVLLGCRDGYVRKFHAASPLDETFGFETYVDYGPFRLGGDEYHDGILTELLGTLAKGSGPVTWKVRTARSHPELKNATDAATGTWTEGRNHTARPRARGGSGLLRLSGVAGQAWAIDSLAASIEQLGRQRFA